MTLVSYLIEMWSLASSGNRQGVLFFASLYTFLVCLYSILYQLKVASWPSTQGVLIKAQLEKFGASAMTLSEQDYKASTIYSYTVNGKSYEGCRLSSWLILASHNARFILNKQMKYIEQYDDGSVKVYFNPKKPNKSYLIKPGIVGMLFTLAFALALPLYYLNDFHLSVM